MSLVSLLFKRGFNSIELALLDRLRGALSSHSGEIFRRQVESVDHVRRMADSREVLCYRRSKKRQAAPLAPFAAKRAELKFATIHFSVGRQSQEWTTDFYLVQGFFFSMVFTPSPRSIRNIKELQIEKVEILVDPSNAIAARAEPVRPISRSSIKLPGWIEQLEPEFTVRDLFEPQPTEVRGRFLEEISGVLPEDYLRLIETTEGLVVKNISILGLSQTYEIVMPDWNYYIVAEAHDAGVLAVKAHSNEPELYFLNYQGGPPRAMGRHLADAVSSLIIENRKHQIR